MRPYLRVNPRTRKKMQFRVQKCRLAAAAGKCSWKVIPKDSVEVLRQQRKRRRNAKQRELQDSESSDSSEDRMHDSGGYVRFRKRKRASGQRTSDSSNASTDCSCTACKKKRKKRKANT